MEIFEDVKIESRMNESDEMFKLLIEIAQDAIYTVDTNGIVTMVNQAMIDITGYSREELMGRNFMEFMHPDEFNYALELHNMIQKNIKPPLFELKYRHKLSGYREAEFSTSPIIKNGKVIGTLGVGRDVTQRNEIQKKLFEREQKFRFIVENASEIIFTLNLEGKFEFVTKNILEIAGYKPDELINRYFHAYVYPDDLQIVLENISKTLDRVFEPIEFRLVTKDKRVIYVKGSCNIIEKNDEIVNVYGILTDITEMKLAEEKLKVIIEEKNILLKEVHHRVKNNLQVIISLLKLKTFNLTDKEVSDVFNSFVERLTSMKLVHEQLYHSESIKYINLKKYVNELLRHIEASYHNDINGQVIVNTNIQNEDVDLDTLIPIGLIINEILTNSFKYAFPDKTGEISMSFFKNENSEFNLIVSDNGIGFDNEVQSNSDTLGLKLIYALVSQIDGTIEMSTENGTKFEIHFFEKSEIHH